MQPPDLVEWIAGGIGGGFAFAVIGVPWMVVAPDFFPWWVHAPIAGVLFVAACFGGLPKSVKLASATEAGVDR